MGDAEVLERGWLREDGISPSGGATRYTPCERFRRSREWSQVRLGAMAGVGVCAVAALERGQAARMTVRTLTRISMALGVSVIDLVPGLAKRHAPEGGVVMKPSERPHWTGEGKRKDQVRRWLGRWLEEQGGCVPAADAILEFSKYQLSRTYLSARASELGVVRRRSAVRAGSGARLWEWCLPGYVAAHPVASDSSSALDEVDAGGGAAVSPCCTTG